ncbi:MAG: hypothetical protein AB7F99_08615 [Vicinamibacterales bacterium]
MFDAALPGIVGYALFVSYYLDLNYALTAQRDWHAAFFLLASLLVVQAWRGRTGWIIAGLSAAVGVSIRPQALVFLPALAVALDAQVRQPGESRRKTIGPLLILTLSGAAGLAVLFLPLILAGALDDFAESIRTLAPDGTYSRVSITSIFRLGILQLAGVRLIAVPLVVAVLLTGAGRQVRRPARAWALAFAGAVTYAPISPFPHLYLRHPLMLFWSMMGAVLVAIAIEARRWPPTTAAALVLLVLSSGVAVKPRFSDPGRSIRAVTMAPDRVSARTPLGYTSMALLPAYAARYYWSDYQSVLGHLRTLPPSIRVANALYGLPALTGPSGRLSVFPAESIALLTIVHASTEDAFVEALRTHRDSVVVWSPAEARDGRHPPLLRLFAAIEALYRHDRSFGEIEVWRRREPSSISSGAAGAIGERR